MVWFVLFKLERYFISFMCAAVRVRLWHECSSSPCMKIKGFFMYVCMYVCMYGQDTLSPYCPKRKKENKNKKKEKKNKKKEKWKNVCLFVVCVASGNLCLRMYLRHAEMRVGRGCRRAPCIWAECMNVCMYVRTVNPEYFVSNLFSYISYPDLRVLN